MAFRGFDVSWLAVLGFLMVLPMIGVGPEWLRLFGVCFLLAFLPFLRSDDGDHGMESYDAGTNARFLVSQLLFGLTPWGFVASLAQLFGQFVPLARYRGRLPTPESTDQTVALRPPFDGEWTVVNGGVTKATAHSWELLAQRYAYDFLLTDDLGRTHSADGIWLEDYYAYGEPVLAPAGGTVVAVKDGLRDHPSPGTGWTEWRTWDVRGNHVVVDHDGEYSLLAHLQEGSVCVEPGERVEVGQQVGRCGNSGNSTEPHLHYQLQDTPDFFTAMGLPPAFSGVELAGANAEDPRTNGRGERRRWAYLRRGQHVRYVTDETAEERGADRPAAR
ncbi:M23 family metallopeptidase [Halomarina oriensis]|uniref:Peptidoglycan DD-metalloendopeptidase family protein n=1 Tax=Halomarina oriensis TaxID=671145 RepID=A0A6B0GNU1_9EURY|nr:M23 family metallopeptidase [Halomarina oriensis]MWG35621.1 peptidoglycan DD-metalloendopeptidase family protein [Halomarina oriensis]